MSLSKSRHELNHSLNNAQSEALALSEEVELVPHDPVWSDVFERERRRLDSSLPGQFVEIRHIGSTAVPGLTAKPIIDLIAGVKDFSTLEATIHKLREIGYAYAASALAQSEDRKWLFLHSGGRRTHHLHLVGHRSDAWNARVGFCERLKQDADLCQRYEALKARLRQESMGDRDAYTQGKEAFIQAAIKDLI